MFLQQQLRFKLLHYIQKFFPQACGKSCRARKQKRAQTTLNSRCSLPLLAKRIVARMLRMRRWSLIRRRAPVAQRQRQSRQQVGQCLSRDEGRAALPHIMCFSTALPQILSLHCRFCLVANVFAEYCLLSFAASSRHLPLLF